MKKLIVLVLTLVCMLGAIGCDGKVNTDPNKSTEQQQQNKPTEQHQFDATILEIHDNHFFVEPCVGMDELKSSDTLYNVTNLLPYFFSHSIRYNPLNPFLTSTV